MQNQEFDRSTVKWRENKKLRPESSYPLRNGGWEEQEETSRIMYKKSVYSK